MAEGLPSFGIAEEFPLLWDIAQQYDFAERLGGCTSSLMAEVDAALRELWDARRNAVEVRAAFEFEREHGGCSCRACFAAALVSSREAKA